MNPTGRFPASRLFSLIRVMVEAKIGVATLVPKERKGFPRMTVARLKPLAATSGTARPEMLYRVLFRCGRCFWR